ncbi:hypothetical protein [Marivita sp. GX14005]|uniref:hypothetical protein n=1 Tax=Marivita sp. GX14005 TaxID=2942276 RepID=UPI002019EA10|nr:hypothetical protein [Marivita sp. GX14005]MCL3881658.1 hypothetical protein [Marivita sp. GX14005]
MRAALIAALFALAGCGADGPPLRPSMATTVTIGSDGIRTSTGVIVNKGPVSVGASVR